ncbi:MAG: 4Fe-4S dicluster domain-containing protein [Deltaproteobacteria bacterium]|jgi:Fe-S-cluster-containing dehydrogenase component|nr:4Fe-4S dicluster domain-containing protein [Deltaproteobacteria bacterium]MBT4089944.1 4Fe-4S dicluster domain-containing protein [Deltaproteobacteria bacterium]MBT4266512.1 4Fe-4S dicluster domain-containing protein [Deltaproteobacteria bacterium]MBT4642899.1 4Fe-4S dicluster domain-containing protein [Deltaproteobacteria bacterium]MBT6504221.1 4Fe-4S dicluster domain-containing protein [Deltaproteobacteria bacterium]
MVQNTMVIDLQKCVGCGACAIACKTENNTPNRKNGQTHNWADYIHETTGSFPDVGYRTLPVLCNHCTDAACINECPTEPTSVFKTPEGVTMLNEERCIGCRSCQEACPYSMDDVLKDGQYSVISYAEEDQPYDAFFADKKELIPGCTSSGQDMVKTVGANPPHQTKFGHNEYSDSHRPGIVGKCIFCEHRTKVGEMPYCVDACPANARIFGDSNDPSSKVSKLLKAQPSFVLLPEKGTKPNVHYIRNYKKA